MLVLLVSIGVLVCSITYYLWLESTEQRKQPPGPKRLPVIGNLHQAPVDYPWRIYQQWTKQYGPIFSVQYGLSTVVILGNAKAARDLLDKRSNIYSSRPHLVMGGDVVSKGYRTLLMPYGDQWRTHQRLQASYINIRVSETYRTLQSVESKQLAFEMLSTNDFPERFHRYSSSLMFALAYGKRMEHGDEPEVKAIGQIMENFLYAARVGTWIVDALPVLNHLPKWMAPWKRYGDQLHQFESTNFQKFWDEAVSRKSWNWCRQAKERPEAQSLSPVELAYDVGIVYEAGSDTTTMALEVFVLAAVLYPAVMKKAQAELDAVVGSDRLPSFDDKARLPYIDAIVKEILRWRPVSAGGIPHAVVQDDEYMGYKIPKGATVIGNHWAISMDEEVYEAAESFRPERWMEQPDLPLVAFGFGRRQCTGQHIARNSLYINIARLLWAFDIGPGTEEREGVTTESAVDPLAFTQGFNSRPLPFKATFNVRSKRAADVVAQEWSVESKNIDEILKDMREL